MVGQGLCVVEGGAFVFDFVEDFEPGGMGRGLECGGADVVGVSYSSRY